MIIDLLLAHHVLLPLKHLCLHVFLLSAQYALQKRTIHRARRQNCHK